MVEALSGSRLPLRTRIDELLLAFLRSHRSSTDDASLPLMDELMAIVEAGGKRLRPTFCFWGHVAGGGPDTGPILSAAACLELVHTFAIVHDDVMDSAPLRRGRPSTWRVMSALASAVPHRGDPARFGTAAAILVGDLGLVLADRMLAESGFDEPTLARARIRFDGMRSRAIAGQLLDLQAAHEGGIDEVQARRIGALKSGGYTVADPLAIGAALASDDADVQRVLAAYGRPLGEAFQLRDDVLGVFGDPELTGKDRDGDLREGKQTVLLAKARAAATSTQRSILDDQVGRADIDASGADRVRAVIRATGALDATLALIAELTREATDALDSRVLGPEATEALAELASDVSDRDT